MIGANVISQANDQFTQFTIAEFSIVFPNVLMFVSLNKDCRNSEPNLQNGDNISCDTIKFCVANLCERHEDKLGVAQPYKLLASRCRM